MVGGAGGIRKCSATYVVEDPSDDELNHGENVESPGAGARGGGESMLPPSYAEFRFSLARWSISPNTWQRRSKKPFA